MMLPDAATADRGWNARMDWQGKKGLERGQAAAVLGLDVSFFSKISKMQVGSPKQTLHQKETKQTPTHPNKLVTKPQTSCKYYESIHYMALYFSQKLKNLQSFLHPRAVLLCQRLVVQGIGGATASWTSSRRSAATPWRSPATASSRGCCRRPFGVNGATMWKKRGRHQKRWKNKNRLFDLWQLIWFLYIVAILLFYILCTHIYIYIYIICDFWFYKDLNRECAKQDIAVIEKMLHRCDKLEDCYWICAFCLLPAVLLVWRRH